MKLTLGQVLAALEEIAPPSLAESWDRVGLMLGGLDAPVNGVLVALDPTLDAVEAAVAVNANCLVTHHPLIFKPLEAIDLARPVGQVVAAALRREINLLAAHTNFDAAAGGVSDVLAGLMDLKEVEPLLPLAERPGAGLGRVGRLTENLRLAVLAGRVKQVLGLKAARVVGRLEMQVRRLAVCGGSGGSLIEAAAAASAQALLTGEIGYHAARQAEALGLAVIEAGHHATEAPAMVVLAERLGAALSAAGFKTAVRAYSARQELYEFL